MHIESTLQPPSSSKYLSSYLACTSIQSQGKALYAGLHLSLPPVLLQPFVFLPISSNIYTLTDMHLPTPLCTLARATLSSTSHPLPSLHGKIPKHTTMTPHLSISIRELQSTYPPTLRAHTSHLTCNSFKSCTPHLANLHLLRSLLAW